MIETIAFLIGLFASADDVEQLRSTAPSYLTTESAREHLGAARLAGVVVGERHAILLAIALGESNFKPTTILVEKSGSLSCGVMQATAVTRAECVTFQTSPIAGYLAGARQLQAWRLNPKCRGSLACGLAGYGGGWAGIDFCRRTTANVCYRAVSARLNLMHKIDGNQTR